jgi:nicotinamide mononucleotide transporter
MTAFATWFSAHGLELTAVVFGIISVLLSVRQHIWSWPTGIINVSLFFALFFQSGLYSDMGLQVVYFVLSVYGWYEWLYGGANRTELHVSRAPRSMYVILPAIGVAFWFALAQITRRLPGTALPYLDAALTTGSLAAQWMMTRKFVENWALWIALDVVYVGMFIFKGLYLTAANYAVYLVLAVMGHIAWKRSLETVPA